MTIKKWIYTIAAASMICMVYSWVDRAGRELNDSYRERHLLGQVATLEIEALDLNQEGKFAEAEAKILLAFAANNKLKEFHKSHPRHLSCDWSERLKLGLAVAVAGQQGYSEEDSLYEDIDYNTPNNPYIKSIVDRYAAILKCQGRTTEAIFLESRSRETQWTYE